MTVGVNASPSTSPASSHKIKEIDRVYRSYPQLIDDEFIQSHLDEWLKE